MNTRKLRSFEGYRQMYDRQKYWFLRIFKTGALFQSFETVIQIDKELTNDCFLASKEY